MCALRRTFLMSESPQSVLIVGRIQPMTRASIVRGNLTEVGGESLITYEGCRYSVSPELIGLDVTVDRFEDKLFIYYNGRLVTFHVLNNNPQNSANYYCAITPPHLSHQEAPRMYCHKNEPCSKTSCSAIRRLLTLQQA
jgi:hypothetical protein